ncbi:Bug family tripartite tricarboxylate transporter substrate binding protein [Candidimonas nitroreducens]|nr:tripartite tricarboxylate transporter substrate binding protein [Candidimonas nitroreducens]
MLLRRLMPLFSLLAAAAIHTPASAADTNTTYPAGPVSIVVPFGPGGGTDMIARIFAKPFSKELGQSVVVRNRGGAGTTIGTAFVAHSAPDGLTLLLNGSTLTYHPAMYKKLPYDVKKDLIPIAFISDQPYVLVANKDFPAKTLGELVAMAKKDPGQIPYGSAGIGSAMHLSAELLWEKLGIKMMHVPYPGTGPAMTDLMGGRVKVVYTTAAGATGMVRSGAVRALGVSSLKRLDTMPDVPTIAESGLPGYQFGSWMALFAPAGTPPAVVNRISQATAKALTDPELLKQFAAQGLETKTGTPEEVKQFFDAEVDRWSGVIKAAGIQPQ